MFINERRFLNRTTPEQIKQWSDSMNTIPYEMYTLCLYRVSHNGVVTLLDVYRNKVFDSIIEIRHMYEKLNDSLKKPNLEWRIVKVTIDYNNKI